MEFSQSIGTDIHRDTRFEYASGSWYGCDDALEGSMDDVSRGFEGGWRCLE